MANENLPTKYIAKFKGATKYIPAVNLLDTLKILIEANRENNQVKRDIKAIEARTNLLIKEIDLRFDLYYKVFGQIFSERKAAIDKSFEVIDKGLKENDKDLISMGLGSLSQVVSSSPFNNLAELSKLLNSNEILEI